MVAVATTLAAMAATTALAQPSGAEVAEQTQPAMVAVISRQAVETRLGSGFFISPDLVVTNKQFLTGDATVTLADAAGRRMKVQDVVGISVDYDLALIKVATEARPHLTISNRSVVLGQNIFLVGAPLRGKSTHSDGKILVVGDTGALMKITAKVSQRNSGAPILDDGGFVIGIATRTKSMPSDEHYGVPADHLADLLAIYDATKDGDPLATKDPDTAQNPKGENTKTEAGKETNTTTGNVVTKPAGGEVATTPEPSGKTVVATPAQDGWQVVAAIDRDLADESRRAQVICGYNPQTQTYGCDPNQLQGFSVRTEVQARPPETREGQTAQADLLYDQNGCASHLRVRIGSTIKPTVVDWGRASFVVMGRAVTAVQTLQSPGVRLEAPPGAVSEETLKSGGAPCLLPVEATQGPSLTFRVPVQFGDQETTLGWDFRRQYMRSDVTEYAALRMLPPPPAVPDPGPAPKPPDEGGLAAPLIGAGIGAGIPVAVAGVVGGILTVAQLSNGQDPTPYILTSALAGGGAALIGGIGGLFIGLFASRGGEEAQEAKAAEHRAALAAWEAQRQAFLKRQAYERALAGLHQGAPAPQVREVPVGPLAQ